MPEPSSKKRKQAKVAIDDTIPTKKVKLVEQAHKGKGKARDREFHLVKTSLVVSIAPIFAGNLRAGVEEMLDSMVMRYIPALRGVVLSHSNLRFLSNTATIQADCPFLVCEIEFDAAIWSPHVGMKLVGKVNLCSPDHVSLLLHRTFNVSIPRHHIPQGEWVFEYGPAENDPEFGPDANAEVTEEEGFGDKAEGDGGGRWVHHLTSEKLGSTDGFLEFTVIGLTVANEMLSLLGSIQRDPFSPEHKPEGGRTAKTNPTESELEDVEVEHEIEPREEGDSDSDEDTFGIVGRPMEEAATEEAIKRAAQEALLIEKETKRKRKEEKAEAKRQKRKKKQEVLEV